MSHTKEPWSASDRFLVNGIDHVAVVASCGRAVALTGFSDAGDRQESVDNARRIVACVNACANLTTEYLESNTALPQFNQLVTMALQRDELLAENAALKYSYQLDEELIGKIQEIISILANRPAIAKVEP